MSAARLAVIFALACAGAWGAHESTSTAANPIRRVVTLLQNMQKKVEAEGKKEQKLFEKFMCYCKNGLGDLKQAIDAAESKLPKVESGLAEAEASKEQLEKDISELKGSTGDAKAAIAKAKAIREKEAAAFAKDSSDKKTNIAALKKAIAAIEAGAAGKFLQTGSESMNRLQNLVINMDMRSADREMLTAFLSQGNGYAPQSGEILGMLKQMLETMEKELAEITAEEEAAVKDFEALIAAKEKELNANTGAIEAKIERAAEVGLEIVEMKEDLDDTAKALAEDKKFLSELEKDCGTKEGEWNERCKIRAEEMLAIGDTIKILNDDDALDLFKKTLPSPSLLQTQTSFKDVKQRALIMLKSIKGDSKLDFIALALRSRAPAVLDKVIGMIDEMVVLLQEEQVQDDEKKKYCEAELDKTEDEKKSLERKVDDLGKAQEEGKDTLATLSEEIEALSDGIKALDKQVAEATENRKEESAEYKEEMGMNVAAKKIMEMAKSRLAKFYSPKAAAASLVTVSSHAVEEAAPPPPPETWGAYKKQTEEAGGILGMMQMMIADVEKEITESKTEEKNAQEEYETLIADSGEKRRRDSKSLSDKESAKADLEKELQQMAKDEKNTKFEVMAVAETLKDLHLECDWLLSNFEARKEARSGEIDALKKAKAVLSGAD
jgi:predicted  nucleic acid-binding Zn-ribbon protein